MAHHFLIKKNKAGEHVVYFKYNAETIFHTEGYSSKSTALKTVESIKKHVGDAPVKEE